MYQTGMPPPPPTTVLIMEGRKEMFYLTTHSTHFIYGYMVCYCLISDRLCIRLACPPPPTTVLIMEGRKEMFYLTTHSTHFIYGYMVCYCLISDRLCIRLACPPPPPHHCIDNGRKEGNVLFNDALNTFYLRLYGVTHMVKNHSDRERGNPLPPHRLLFPISSKGSFICTIPQTG